MPPPSQVDAPIDAGQAMTFGHPFSSNIQDFSIATTVDAPAMASGASQNGITPSGDPSPSTTPTTFTLPRARSPPMTQKDVIKIPRILPHERVFPIQIGSQLFKLSGASISSDAPSYFSQYFYCQIKRAQETGEDLSTAIRTLYIDRDPETFHDISLHLQGYHVQPRDGTHFVRLFADAQFYSLLKLISQLFDESIFISIGHREFQIPRELFNGPGKSPNFFTLGFAVFFSNPKDLFPGLEREHLIRPPSILPPSVPNRSADVFADLVHFLSGYPVHIRNETHRADLLRDCRYFNFKGLEQRLIPHTLSYNQARARHEILLRLEDILKSGISITNDQDPEDPVSGRVTYARPFTDPHPADLVLEIAADEATVLHLTPDGPRVEFFRDTRSRVARLFEVLATKLDLPPTTQPLGLLMATGGRSSQPPTPGHTPLSDDLVRVAFEDDADVTLNGKAHSLPLSADEHPSSASPPADAATEDVFGPRKRRRVDSNGTSATAAAAVDDQWVISAGHWRLRIRGAQGGKSGVEVVLVPVKLEAYSSERSRNAKRGFLRP
ncbi:hypothetical protein BN1708_013107 [Verticillium longisporum]|uniref:Potassium channel tetramerisation-type BTB domain-containing protein n=2 Tax=Verticillium longisporum TaxID=100787 RepID=A0A0G4LHA7_VERLO|nr:hypothetical protein BN1708_013107 [Verticillium longisporum]